LLRVRLGSVVFLLLLDFWHWKVHNNLVTSHVELSDIIITINPLGTADGVVVLVLDFQRGRAV